MVFMSERPPSPAFSADLYLDDLSAPAAPYMPVNVNTPSIEGPGALSGDGQTLVYFSSRYPTGSVAALFLYDVASGATIIPARINQLHGVQNPALSYDGRFLTAQYQVSDFLDLYIVVQDLKADTLLGIPNLNAINSTNFDPCLNGDGSLVAFVSNRLGTLGAFDVFLYSVPGDSMIALPGLNSSAQDMAPSISADGRYIAFQSGRTTGEGLIDVYVYDREAHSLLPLPGANTNMSEFHPALSPDGSYLAYTTETSADRDIRLYDIRAQRLIPMPGLNDAYFFDYFPSLADR